MSKSKRQKRKERRAKRVDFQKAKKKQAPGVHRLSDFESEEVSAVDRAANRRKFLIVKNDNGDEKDIRESVMEKALALSEKESEADIKSAAEELVKLLGPMVEKKEEEGEQPEEDKPSEMKELVEAIKGLGGREGDKPKEDAGEKIASQVNKAIEGVNEAISTMAARLEKVEAGLGQTATIAKTLAGRVSKIEKSTGAGNADLGDNEVRKSAPKECGWEYDLGE